MRRLLLLVAMMASACSGSTRQIFLSTIGAGVILTTGNGYISLGTSSSPAFGTEPSIPDAMYAIMPTSGVFTSLCARLSAAAGAGASYTFTLYKSTVGTASTTALLVTFSGASTTQQCDNADAVRVAPGDLICVQTSKTGSPSTVSESFAVAFIPDIPGETILFAGNAAQTAAFFYSFNTSQLVNATENVVFWPSPCAGTVKKLYAQSSVAAGAGVSWTWTADKNSTGQSLTATAANVTTVQSDLNVAHNFSVSAGDTLDMHLTIAGGTPASSGVYASVVFLPNTLGQFILPAARNASPSNSVVQYGSATGRVATWNSTEASAPPQMAVPMQIQAIYAMAITSPGSGPTWAIALRQNSGATTGLTATINSTSVASAIGATVNIKLFDLLDIQDTPTSNPNAAGEIHWTMLCYIAPTDSHFFSIL